MDEYQVIVCGTGHCILRTTNRQRAIDYSNEQNINNYVFSLGAKMIIYRNWGADRTLHDKGLLAHA